MSTDAERSEPLDGAAPADAVRGGTGARIGMVLSESAVYGVVLVSSLIIIGQRSDTSLDVFLKVLGTVVVFWIAHVFATVVAGISANRAALGPLILHGIRHSAGLLIAALVPLIVILLGAIGVLSDDTAVWSALWLDVALLGVLGYIAVAQRTRHIGVRFAGAAVTALLGVGIMVLKAFIH